jgi:hypothetical protein
MQSEKMNLDSQTKLRLLICLINDEGRSKLETSLEKLTTRILDNLDSQKEIILKFLSQAYFYFYLEFYFYQ